jgi:hypothetical protein
MLDCWGWQMTASNKPRYRTPSILVDVDVDLDQFDDDDIIEYLRNQGYTVSGGDAVSRGPVAEANNQIDTADLDHIYTLAVAGQLSVAQQEALQVVGKAIGRPLQ